MYFPGNQQLKDIKYVITFKHWGNKENMEIGSLVFVCTMSEWTFLKEIYQNLKN